MIKVCHDKVCRGAMGLSAVCDTHLLFFITSRPDRLWFLKFSNLLVEKSPHRLV